MKTIKSLINHLERFDNISKVKIKLENNSVCIIKDIDCIEYNTKTNEVFLISKKLNLKDIELQNKD